MEVVNTLDIDGTQWEITDTKAREDIANLKLNQENIELGRIELPLKQPYTATDIKLLGVCRMGKLIFGCIRITNLTGENVGTNSVLQIADFPFDITAYTECIAVDMNTNNAYRMQIFTDKHMTIVSTPNLINGSNELTANFICFEA